MEETKKEIAEKLYSIEIKRPSDRDYEELLIHVPKDFCSEEFVRVLMDVCDKRIKELKQR